VFRTDSQRRYFLTLLGETAERFNAEWHAYCLLGNHYHLMVRTPEGNGCNPPGAVSRSWWACRGFRRHGCRRPAYLGVFTAAHGVTPPDRTKQTAGGGLHPQATSRETCGRSMVCTRNT
jgi:hypothetical protein